MSSENATRLIEIAEEIAEFEKQQTDLENKITGRKAEMKKLMEKLETNVGSNMPIRVFKSTKTSKAAVVRFLPAGVDENQDETFIKKVDIVEIE